MHPLNSSEHLLDEVEDGVISNLGSIPPVSTAGPLALLNSVTFDLDRNGEVSVDVGHEYLFQNEPFPITVLSNDSSNETVGEWLLDEVFIETHANDVVAVSSILLL